MSLLCELALKYDTDKCPEWHGGTGHSYTPYYHDILHNRPINNMLEIGICSNTKAGSGPSLKMWAEYFPQAHIYGIDNCPWVMVNNERIHSFLLDQGNAEEMREFTEHGLQFDLIIDDGSHEPEHQILSANILFPCLAPDGLYVIEDVADGQKEFIQSRLDYPSEVKEFNLASRSDDRWIILRNHNG